MTLLPILPVLPDETLTSYMRRVAKFHAGIGDVYTFLGALDLSRTDVIDPTPETFERISDLTGQPIEVLHKTVIRSIQPRIRALGNEHFYTEFANLKQTSFCPACLLEDSAPGSPSDGLRVGRVSWRLSPVRTCTRHHFPLVREKMKTKSHRFQNMDEVAPDDAALAHLVETTERREPTVLQRYVETRLAGGRGPHWLDDQPIDLGTRACEMLGGLLAQTVHEKLPGVSRSEFDFACTVGFEHAAQGEDGIRAALQNVSDYVKHNRSLGGPAKVFGSLYSWLDDPAKTKPFGPIRDIVREYILDNFAIDPNTTLFGEVVTERRNHNIYSLARHMGWDPKTVHRALVSAGLIQRQPEHQHRHIVLDAGVAEAILTPANATLSSREICELLNCHRTQAEQLVLSGILPRVIQQGDRGKNTRKPVKREDVEVFLQDLMRPTQRVEKATAGMCDIPRAARATGWSVVDIVQGLLAGKFNKVECADPGQRFLGVLVDPREVRRVLSEEHSRDLVTFEEAACLLEIKHSGVRPLLHLRDRTGLPFLNEQFIPNAEGGMVNFVSRKEIEAFLERHITLADIAARLNCDRKLAKARLLAAKIWPVNTAERIGRTFYRREDVEPITGPLT